MAVLDIDICGPSQPRVLGVLDEQVHQSGSGWSPVVSNIADFLFLKEFLKFTRLKQTLGD